MESEFRRNKSEFSGMKTDFPVVNTSSIRMESECKGNVCDFPFKESDYRFLKPASRRLENGSELLQHA